MSFDVPGGGLGPQIGSASFGLGVDLTQLERDLDRAESIARDRARRIQRQLDAIRVSTESIGRGANRAQAPQPINVRQQIIVTRVTRVVQAPPPAPPPAVAPIRQTQTVTIQRIVRVLSAGAPAPAQPPALRQTQDIAIQRVVRIVGQTNAPPARQQQRIQQTQQIDIRRLSRVTEATPSPAPRTPATVRQTQQILVTRATRATQATPVGQPALPPPVRQIQNVSVSRIARVVSSSALAPLQPLPGLRQSQEITVGRVYRLALQAPPRLPVLLPPRTTETQQVAVTRVATVVAAPTLPALQPAPTLAQTQDIAIRRVPRVVQVRGALPSPERFPAIQQTQDIIVRRVLRVGGLPTLPVPRTPSPVTQTQSITIARVARATLSQAPAPVPPSPVRQIQRVSIERRTQLESRAQLALPAPRLPVPVHQDQTISVTRHVAVSPAPALTPPIQPPALHQIQNIEIERISHVAGRPVGRPESPPRVHQTQQIDVERETRVLARRLSLPAPPAYQPLHQTQLVLVERLASVRGRLALPPPVAPGPIQQTQDLTVRRIERLVPPLPLPPPAAPVALNQTQTVEIVRVRRATDRQATAPVQPGPIQQQQQVTVVRRRRTLDQPLPNPLAPAPLQQTQTITVNRIRRVGTTAPPPPLPAQPRPVQHVQYITIGRRIRVTEVDIPPVPQPARVQQAQHIDVTRVAQVSRASITTRALTPQPTLRQSQQVIVARIVRALPAPAIRPPALPAAIRQTQPVFVTRTIRVGGIPALPAPRPPTALRQTQQVVVTRVARVATGQLVLPSPRRLLELPQTQSILLRRTRRIDEQPVPLPLQPGPLQQTQTITIRRTTRVVRPPAPPAPAPLPPARQTQEVIITRLSRTGEQRRIPLPGAAVAPTIRQTQHIAVSRVVDVVGQIGRLPTVAPPPPVEVPQTVTVRRRRQVVDEQATGAQLPVTRALRLTAPLREQPPFAGLTQQYTGRISTGTPQIAYRAMSPAELRNAVRRGAIQSDRRYTTPAEGRTQFGNDPRELAARFAPFREAVHPVEVAFQRRDAITQALDARTNLRRMDTEGGWRGTEEYTSERDRLASERSRFRQATAQRRAEESAQSVLVGADLQGLAVRQIRQPANLRQRTLRGDVGLGIGVDEPIPLSRIRTVHAIGDAEIGSDLTQQFQARLANAQRTQQPVPVIPATAAVQQTTSAVTGIPPGVARLRAIQGRYFGEQQQPEVRFVPFQMPDGRTVYLPRQIAEAQQRAPVQQPTPIAPPAPQQLALPGARFGQIVPAARSAQLAPPAPQQQRATVQDRADELHARIVASGVAPQEAARHVEDFIGVRPTTIPPQPTPRVATQAQRQTRRPRQPAAAQPTPAAAPSVGVTGDAITEERISATLRAAGVSEQVTQRYTAQATAAAQLTQREQQLTATLVDAGLSRTRAAATARDIAAAERAEAQARAAAPPPAAPTPQQPVIPRALFNIPPPVQPQPAPVTEATRRALPAARQLAVSQVQALTIPQPGLVSPGLPAPPARRISVVELRPPELPAPPQVPIRPRVALPAPQQLALPGAGASTFVPRQPLIATGAATGQQTAANQLYQRLVASGMSPAQAAQHVQSLLGTTPNVQATTPAARTQQQNAANTAFQQLINAGIPHAQAAASVRTALGVTPLPPGAGTGGLRAPQQAGAGRGAGGGGAGGGAQQGGTGGAGGGFGGLLNSLGLGSPIGQLRVGLGLVGIPLGINVLSGLARDLHRIAIDTVTDADAIARSLRQVGIAYGQLGASQLQRAGQRFQADPTTRGTGEAFQRSAVAVQSLSTQFGLSERQIEGVLTSAGQLSRLYGVDLPQASTALQSAIEGDVSATQQFGLNLTDENGRLRSVGVSYDNLVQVVGRARAAQILYRDIQDAVARQNDAAIAANNNTTASLDRVGKAADNLRSNLTQLVAKPYEVIVSVLANLVSGFQQEAQPTQADVRHPIGQAPNQGVRGIQQNLASQAPQPVAAAQGRTDLGVATGPLAALGNVQLRAGPNFEPTQPLIAPRTGGTAQQTQRPVPVTITNPATAPITTPLTLGQPGQTQQQRSLIQQPVAAAAVPQPSLPQAPVSPRDIGDVVANTTQQLAGSGQTPVAPQQVRVAAPGQPDFSPALQGATQLASTQEALTTSTDNLRSAQEQLDNKNQDLIGSAQQLGSIINIQARAARAGTIANAAAGPQFPLAPLNAGQRTVVAQQRAQELRDQQEAQRRALQAGSALSVTDPGVQRQLRLVDAQHEQAAAQNQLTQAQGREDILQIQSESRRLAAQQQLNTYSATQIELQDRLAPLLLREAELRDQITLATRENLDLTERQLRAQQAALPATTTLATLNFQERQAEARAVLAATQRAQGQAPTFDIGEQAKVIQNIELQKRPAAELANIESQRGVELAQQAQQADEVAKQLAVIPQRRETQAIQGQEIPLQAAQRTVQAQADAFTRSLQVTELANAPALIKAQTEVINARLLEVQSSIAVSAAQAAVAGLPSVTNIITIDGNVAIDPALIQQLTDAVSSRTIQVLIDARDTSSNRVSPNIPGGR